MKIPTRTYVDGRFHSIMANEPVSPGKKLHLSMPSIEDHGRAVDAEVVCVDYRKYEQADASGAQAEAWFETVGA